VPTAKQQIEKVLKRCEEGGKLICIQIKKTASKEAIFKDKQDKLLTFHVEHFSGLSQVR